MDRSVVVQRVLQVVDDSARHEPQDGVQGVVIPEGIPLRSGGGRQHSGSDD